VFGLGQLCPTQMAYWAKKCVVICVSTRAVSTRAVCQLGPHIE